MPQTRLKQLREEAVLTVHELAEASGVSDDTISKIENGQRIARPSTLRKLAQALVVSPQELRKPAAVEEVALAGKAEAPPVGAVPNSLEDLLKSRGVRTRHLADENLKGKLDGLPLEAAVQTVREVGTEMEAIAPDLAHLVDQHRHNSRAMRLFSEASIQFLIARWSLRVKQGQEFVPSGLGAEVKQTLQDLERAELALVGTG